MKFLPPIKLVCMSSLLFLLHSCNKQTLEGSLTEHSVETYKNWLTLNGGEFKNEMIQIVPSDQLITAKSGQGITKSPKLVTGKLDWEQAKMLIYKSTVYTYVPFVFSGSRILKSREGRQVSFQIVFRSSGASGIEAALLSHIHSESRNSINEQLQEKLVLSYMLLNGNKSTLWVSGGTNGKMLKANRSEKVRANSHQRVMTNCTEHTLVDYTVVCHTEDDGTYSTTCWLEPDYSYYYQCEDDEEEYDDWPPGGGEASNPSLPDDIITTESSSKEYELNIIEDEPFNKFEGIKYTLSSHIVKNSRSGFIVSVVLDPIVAIPMVSSYMDANGRTLTRQLTLFNHVNSYTILQPPTQVLCYWSCNINAVYKVNNQIYATRNWQINKEELRW